MIIDIPSNLKLPPNFLYNKGVSGRFNIEFESDFDAVIYFAGKNPIPKGKTQKPLMEWLMSLGITFDDIKDHRNKILDVIRQLTDVAMDSNFVTVPPIPQSFTVEYEEESESENNENLDALLASIRSEKDESARVKDLDALLTSVRSEETSTTINPAKFFDNDKYDDHYKELVDEGSIDDQNLSEEERQKGIAAFRSNKLDFKKFVTDIQSLKPEVEQLNQEPLTIREQFFTAPKIEPSKLIPAESEISKIEPSKLIPAESEISKIEPSKLIPNEDVEISEEFNEKLDELIAVIKEDNKLEEERKKFENREKQREKRKNRENRIENKNQTKLFALNLKKGTGKISNFFESLKRFLTFGLLGGLVGTLYKFIMDPKNNEKIEATQEWLKNYWPVLLAGAAYFLTPLGGFVNFLVSTVGKFALKLGSLIIKHPLLAAAVVGASALVLTTAGPAYGGISKEMDAEGRLPGDPGFDPSTRGKVTAEKLYEVRPDLVENVKTEMEGRSDGGLIGFSRGGLKMGTDTVPALLTPGEVVINKPTVDAVGAEPLLALNKQFGGSNANRPKVGKVMGFQGGGFVISPEERRMLDTISGAEGTTGYGTLYGGRNIPELAKGEMTINQVLNMQETGMYKGQSVYKTDRYNSTATGRYQFMPVVLREEANSAGYDLDKTKFTPRLQDELILRRIRRKRGVTPELLKAEGMSNRVIDKLAPEFASFPNLYGPDAKGRYGTNTSYYGQGGKSAEYIKNLYNKSDGQFRELESTTSTGSLGTAFESDSGINQRKMDDANATKRIVSNPLETFVFEPLRRALSIGTPNIPTETRNFMMPPVETPKQNQSSNQTGDVPVFNISSGNRMRDLVSKDLGIHDLVGAS